MSLRSIRSGTSTPAFTQCLPITRGHRCGVSPHEEVSVAEITMSVFQCSPMKVKCIYMGLCRLCILGCAHSCGRDDGHRCNLHMELDRFARAGHLLTDGISAFRWAWSVDVTGGQRVWFLGRIFTLCCAAARRWPSVFSLTCVSHFTTATF